MANIKDIKKEEILKYSGNISQIASIKPYIMSEGKASGIKAFDITTGSGLCFTVLESKCLDIGTLSYKGINISFLSKPGFVAPNYYSTQDTEFPRIFQGGMLYTCGLGNVGQACIDQGVKHSLHGRIGNTPAEKISTESKWENDEYIINIKGEMKEAALFNENLVLRRNISTKLGSKKIFINDEVENLDIKEQDLMILYHFNFGYPFLDEGTRVIIQSLNIEPISEYSKSGIKKHNIMDGPIDGCQEQVFYHNVKSDKNGLANVIVINDKLHLGVYIRFNTNQLPRLVQWKSMASGDYALGIEPSNCQVEGKAKERELGTLQKIKSFSKRSFDLELGILDGQKEIEEYIYVQENK